MTPDHTSERSDPAEGLALSQSMTPEELALERRLCARVLDAEARLRRKASASMGRGSHVFEADGDAHRIVARTPKLILVEGFPDPNRCHRFDRKRLECGERVTHSRMRFGVTLRPPTYKDIRAALYDLYCLDAPQS